ncbi:asparaginase [Paenibacillus sp. N4]|uniref:asparaginase n=1 Tax=Paenibacillus vietnamensis TaxID=2590547 RepID=UPI001CD096E3|nr:asparaginase domain-containing protein [Paenibacillus vietnamensis]MCA0756159.1 asparaginase [Paenibacillus vietnamensis]
MLQLLVIFTGGTIGSRRSGEGIDVHASGSYALIDAYNNSGLHRSDVTLTAVQPLNLLSENLTPDDWIALATAIREADHSAYDGIVVTHGSDTLAYSAALLGYLFADAKLPVVLTASNYPLEDERSNGLRNFSCSIDFIADACLPGVFAVYEDDKGSPHVYIGTRITQAVSFTDQFGSPYGITYGRMEQGRFQWHDHPHNPMPESLRSASKAGLEWEPGTLKLEDGIVYIKPYPGLNYSYYDFSERRPKAVLHDLHHSGTASAIRKGPYSLPQFIADCRALDIDVYICPIKDRSAALYASSLRLIEAGAVILENMSMEAAVTKLMLAYGFYSDRAEAEAFMTGTSVYFERNEVRHAD